MLLGAVGPHRGQHKAHHKGGDAGGPAGHQADIQAGCNGWLQLQSIPTVNTPNNQLSGSATATTTECSSMLKLENTSEP